MKINCLYYVEEVRALVQQSVVQMCLCLQYQNLPMEGSNNQPLQATPGYFFVFWSLKNFF